MSGRCNPRLAKALRRFTWLASLAAMGVGVAAFMAWPLGLWEIESPQTVWTIHPLSAVIFLLLGGSLWLQRRVPSRPACRVAQAFALSVIVLALVLLLGTILVTMATNAVVNFLLLGLCLLLLDVQDRRLQRLVQLLALVTLVVAFLPAVGILFQVGTFTRFREGHIPMAATSALTFLLLGAGILASRPERGFMASLCSDGQGGRLLRRLLPTLLLAPILLGLISLWAQRAWGYDASFGIGLMVTGLVVLTTCLIWWHALMLDRLEAALQASETKLRTLIDTSPDLIMIRDHEGRYLLANPALAQLLGRPVPEVLGKRDVDLFEAGTAERIMAHDQAVMASECPMTYEIQVRGAEGADRIFLSSKYPYYSPDHELIGVIAISRDITERKRIEEALRESENRIRVVLNNSPVFLFSVDREGQVLLAKGKGLEALSLDASEVAGHAITEAFHAFPAFGEAYRRALAGESFRASLDVGETSFDVWFTPLQNDEHDQIVGVIGVATDVTERKRLEAQLRAQYEKLRELDKLKGDFVNAVSHDLRTPLTSILGYAEFLEDEIGGPLSAQQHAFVDQIEKSSMRLEGMVNDLLDFARLDAGTFRLHCEEADLAGRIREIVESLRPQAEEHRLDLRASLPEEPVVQVLDPQRIERVVANLVGNSLKFTPEGGRVEVRLRVDEDGVVCEVSDTGIGIAKEDLPKLFKRFSQLEAGARMKAGTGLGLSISKAQVEAHGGQIGVRSEPGKGSTFWFRLPRGVPPPCRIEPPAA